MKNGNPLTASGALFWLCIGSAVGMGNIWMFPTRVSLYMGAVFSDPLFYFRHFNRFHRRHRGNVSGTGYPPGPIDAFGMACETKGRRKNRRDPWLIPVLGAFAMAIGYTVVMGWILKYMVGTFTGATLAAGDIDGFAANFGSMASAWGNNFWQILALLICMVILMFGVEAVLKRPTRL